MRIIEFFIPPVKWRFPVIILLGVFTGLTILVLHISNSLSYLSDKPETCTNCHVMTSEYATWERSSHARVAKCNDCHVPQDNLIRTYAFKAQDGFKHAAMFTFRLEPQVIRMEEGGINVVQENCIRCHANFIHLVSIINVTGDIKKESGGLLCLDCHRDVPHGQVHSLASTPYAHAPTPSPITPKWLQDFLSGSNGQK